MLDNKKESQVSEDINIEKLDYEVFIKEERAYTSICNEAAQNVRDPIALAIWTFLQTCPPKWVPQRTQIMNHFNIGETKYKRHIAYLKKCNLIDYYRARNKNGTLGKVTLHVLSGRAFKLPDNVTPFSSKKVNIVEPVEQFNHRYENHTCGEKPSKHHHRYENQTSGFDVHINTTSLQNTKVINSTVTVPVLSSENHEKVKALQELLKEKLNDKYVSYNQADNIIKQHAKDVSVEWSLNNYLYHLSTASGSNIEKKYAVFAHHIKKHTFFEDKKTRADEETRLDVTMRKNVIGLNTAALSIASIIEPLKDKAGLEDASKEIRGVKEAVATERKARTNSNLLVNTLRQQQKDWKPVKKDLSEIKKAIAMKSINIRP